MDFIKKNKFTVVAIACFLLLVVILFQIKTIFFPDMGKAIYGNRLDGMKEVEITDKEIASLKDTIKENESVQKVYAGVNGKIVNVIITVNDDLGLEQAKGLATVVYQEFDKDAQKFYDFQVFVQKNNDASDFPIIGYKHHNKEGFSWTRDRVAS